MLELKAPTPRGRETTLSVCADEACDFAVAAGQFVSIVIDAEPLVGSLFAFASEDQTEALSVGNTRILLGTLRPRPGDRLFSNRRRPLFVWVDDSSAVHDLLMPVAACARDNAASTEPTIAARSAKLDDALQRVGADLAHPPDPLNLFMNVQAGPDGRIRICEPVAKAGDRVVLRATTWLSCVLLVWAQRGPQRQRGAHGVIRVAVRNPLDGKAKHPHS